MNTEKLLRAKETAELKVKLLKRELFDLNEQINNLQINLGWCTGVITQGNRQSIEKIITEQDNIKSCSKE
jgi:hypothetical protein